MNIWAYFRAAVIFFVAVSSFFVPLGPQAKPEIGWAAVGAIFAFCPVGLLFVFGLQRFNPKSATTWRRPSWKLNPLNFREPLQFFHLAGFVCLAQGLVTSVRVAASPLAFYPETFVPLAMASGIFLGLQIVMQVFRSKVQCDT